MNASILNDLKQIKYIKNITRITIVVAIVTYGFFLTHASIGLDDTGIERYFIEGWAPYVGRWVLFLFNYESIENYLGACGADVTRQTESVTV